VLVLSSEAKEREDNPGEPEEEHKTIKEISANQEVRQQPLLALVPASHKLLRTQASSGREKSGCDFGLG